MKRRFNELDALRGIAALLVVFFHFTVDREKGVDFLDLGVTGVDLFFIISGFVIFLSIEKVSGYKQFIINRVSRLYPTYWSCVIFTFIVVIMIAFTEKNFSSVSLTQFLGNLTMFQFYFKIEDLEGTYWTMIIEMIFYIAMVILLVSRLLKHLDLIFISIILITVASVNFAFDNPWVSRFFYLIPLLQFLPLFYAGILFYRLISKETNLFKCYSIMVFCFVCQLLLFKHAGHSKYFVSFIEYTIMLSVYFVLFILFINNKLTFLVNNVTLFLGKISYSLYLIHWKISKFYIIPKLHDELKWNFWIVVAINLACVISIATFITYFIEIPYSKKMRNKLYLVFSINKRKVSLN